MKHTKILSFLISILLALSLCLTSCVLPLPGDTPNIEDTPSPDDGNKENPDENEKNPDDTNQNEPILPEVVLPTLPEMDDNGSFGEYTTYYLLDTVSDTFTLNAVQQNTLGEIRTIPLSGTYEVSEGNYTLHYDSGEVGYGKYHNGVFVLTDESFLSEADADTRGGDGVTKVEITPTLGSTDYGYRDLAYFKNGEDMQSFYRDILAACEDFANSTDDIPNTSDYYKICELNFTKHNLSADEAKAVWSLFRSENPAYYWLSSVCYYTPDLFYLVIDGEYSLYEYRALYDKDISDMLTSALALVNEGMSDIECALAMHRFIVSRIDYAYIEGTEEPETASWAHNILGAARVGGGVCETYAKTFQYLCNAIGIPTLYVTGYAGEPHAWNLIYLAGEWVGVDVTWDDMGDGYYLTSHFGLSSTALAQKHTQDEVGGTGTAYHYKTPTVSPLGLSLVTLYDADGNETLHANLDSALSAITDQNGTYSLKFYNYTEYGAYLVTAPDIYYYISLATLPECASLFIGGEYYTKSHSESTVIHLTAMDFEIPSPLTTKDISLKNAHPTHKGIRLLANFTFEGEENAVYPSVVGTGVTISGEGNFIVFGRLVVDELISTGVTLYNNGEVQNLSADSLCVLANDATVLIHHFTLTGTSPFVENHGADLYIKDFDVTASMENALRLEIDTAPSTVHLLSAEDFEIAVVLTEGKDAHLTRENFLLLNEYSQSLALRIFTAEDRTTLYDRSDFFEVNSDFVVTKKALTVTSEMITTSDTLLAYFGTSDTLTLPSGITRIGAEAFAESALTSLEIPEGTTHLLRGALYNANLDSVILPKTLLYYDTTIDNFTRLSPITSYHFNGSYTEWARLVALSDYTLWVSSVVPTLTCNEGSPLTQNVLGTVEGMPYRAVSGVLRSITSMTNVKGSRMHLLHYDDNGNAKLVIYDIYSSGAYGTPTTLGTFTLTEVAEGRYSFSLDFSTTTYYISIENGSLTYTDKAGNAVNTYPS